MTDTNTDPRTKSRETWDEMADGWRRRREEIWDASRVVGEAMVKTLDPQPGETILDLAAGPGDTGFLAAKTIGNDGVLISADFAPQMVEVAKERAKELGLTNVEFQVENAEEMTLGSGSVDGILCRWGFMLMIDPDTAFRECRRVLKDGGRLVFSVWGAPEKNPWVIVPGMALRQLGYEPPGDPFGPGGMFSLAAHDRLRTALAAAGFTDVEIEEVELAWEFGSFEDWWEFMMEIAGAIANLLKELAPDDLETAKDALRAAADQYRKDDGSYSFPGVTINVSAST